MAGTGSGSRNGNSGKNAVTVYYYRIPANKSRAYYYLCQNIWLYRQVAQETISTTEKEYLENQVVAHASIIGMTESGKDYLARHIARQARAKGYAVSVLDPIREKWRNWPHDHITDCPHKFLAHAQSTQDHLLILNECKDTVGYGQPYKDMQKFTYFPRRSRHEDGSKTNNGIATGPGHMCLFLMQNSTDVPPTYRSNSQILYLFACGKKQAAELAEYFNCDTILEATKLKRYYYMKIRRYQEPIVDKAP